MKNILIIGMGRFGRHCARKLNEMGHQVMAIDTREDRIDTVLPYVTDGLIGNSTKKDFMKAKSSINMKTIVPLASLKKALISLPFLFLKNVLELAQKYIFPKVVVKK